MRLNKNFGARYEKALSLKPLNCSVVAAVLITATSLVEAEPTFQRDKNQFINIGAAFRASYSSIKDAAPNGQDRSNDFEVEEARLYTNGKVHENVSFELNFARNNSDNRVDILDAHVGLEFNKFVNVWMGVFCRLQAVRLRRRLLTLPPSTFL